MLQSDAVPEPSNQLSGPAPSPLFRPEALLAPERFYGELLLIRPFSLASLGWLAAGLAAAIVSFLFFGEYRETVRASAVVTGPALQTSASDGLQLKIHVKSSGQWGQELAPGRRVAIRCLSCVDQSARITGTILQVAPSTVENAAVNETVQIALAVPSRVAISPDAKMMQLGASLELTIPIGRRSLAHGLLERLEHFKKPGS
jgi:hypothetical protein